VLVVPICVKPEKKSTRLTVAGDTALAVAETVVAAPTVTVEPVAGTVNATLGPVIFTFTIAEVVLAPVESVTLAVNAVIPATVGIHGIV
jgi:hypothetical protein